MSVRRLSGARVSLTVDGVDYWSQATSAVMEQDPELHRRFDGGYQFADPKWVLRVEAVQSLESGSFWRAVWEKSGQIVPFRFAPAGNVEASDDEPHFVGTAQIGPRPTVGGEAKIRGSHSFEATLFIISGPEMVYT